MKKSKDELLSTIDSLPLSDDEKIALMEDITDSLVDNSAEIESLKAELESQKKKYIDRFMGRDEEVKTEEVTEEKIEEEPEVEEPEVEEEKEKIDVKEI